MSLHPPDEPRRRTLQLARVRGVPVVVSPSWLVIGLLLTVIYGPVVHDAVPGIGGGAAYLSAFGFAVLFALCILAHELGHTLVSAGLGYPVRRVVLFMLGGVSEIEGEPRRPRDELFIAASGPLVSVVLTLGCWGGYAAAPDSSLLEVLLLLLAASNALLAVFNLLPGLPLDGGRLLRAAVWGFGASSSTGTRVAGFTGRVFAIGLAVSGLLIDRTSVGLATGLLTIVMALYLWSGASQAVRVAELSDRLPEIRVDALVRPGLLVPGDLSVAEALDRVHRQGARGLVLADRADRPAAIVDEMLVGAIPLERRPWTPLTEVARRLEPGLVVADGIDAKDLLDHMQRTPAREYLVTTADGSPAGIIATADFVQALGLDRRRRRLIRR